VINNQVRNLLLTENTELSGGEYTYKILISFDSPDVVGVHKYLIWLKEADEDYELNQETHEHDIEIEVDIKRYYVKVQTETLYVQNNYPVIIKSNFDTSPEEAITITAGLYPPDMIDSGLKYLRVNEEETDLEWASSSGEGSSPLDMAIQGWQSDLIFSTINAHTVAWASGDITLTDGTTYNITGANVEYMSALTYIYFDSDVSLTALQTTEDATIAVGYGKILIAVAQNNTDIESKATFQVFGGSGGNTIMVDNIDIAQETLASKGFNMITEEDLSQDR